jgi:predicted dehydrogenase
LVSLHASWVEARPFLGARIELIGDRGRIEIDLGVRATRLVKRDGSRVTESTTEFDYVDPDPSWAREMELFRNMIDPPAGDGLPANSPLTAHRLAFAAYESARAGGLPVALAGTAAAESPAVDAIDSLAKAS